MYQIIEKISRAILRKPHFVGNWICNELKRGKTNYSFASFDRTSKKTNTYVDALGLPVVIDPTKYHTIPPKNLLRKMIDKRKTGAFAIQFAQNLSLKYHPQPDFISHCFIHSYDCNKTKIQLSWRRGQSPHRWRRAGKPIANRSTKRADHCHTNQNNA
jgi:hypothetical protein